MLWSDEGIALLIPRIFEDLTLTNILPKLIDLNGISNIIYSKSLMHALSSCEGLFESNFHVIQSLLSMPCPAYPSFNGSNQSLFVCLSGRQEKQMD